MHYVLVSAVASMGATHHSVVRAATKAACDAWVRARPGMGYTVQDRAMAVWLTSR
jgi:hypothetical protein